MEKCSFVAVEQFLRKAAEQSQFVCRCFFLYKTHKSFFVNGLSLMEPTLYFPSLLCYMEKLSLPHFYQGAFIKILLFFSLHILLWFPFSFVIANTLYALKLNLPPAKWPFSSAVTADAVRPLCSICVQMICFQSPSVCVGAQPVPPDKRSDLSGMSRSGLFYTDHIIDLLPCFYIYKARGHSGWRNQWLRNK